MKVQLIIPKWSKTMPWIPLIADSIRKAGHDPWLGLDDAWDHNSDLSIYGWLNKETVKQINERPRKPTIVFIRRYEVFQGAWKLLDVSKVDHIYFVNEFFHHILKDKIKVSSSVLYNVVDLSRFSLTVRRDKGNVAMVGNINPRKNVPLALQMLRELGKDYTLHLAGQVQCAETWWYVQEMAKKMFIRVIYHGHISQEHINKWLDQMDYVLSCATSEGNPNAVLEGMAKGLKPVIHAWPGSESQFPKQFLFKEARDACDIMRGGDFWWEPEKIRKWVEDKFSPRNYDVLVEKINELLGGSNEQKNADSEFIQEAQGRIDEQRVSV